MKSPHLTNTLTDYCPVSNLTELSKVLEKIVAFRLTDHLCDQRLDHCHVRYGSMHPGSGSRILLVAILQGSPLGKPPGRCQPCAKLSAVSVHLLKPVGVLTSSPSALLSRILQGKNLISRGEHYRKESHDQQAQSGLTYDTSRPNVAHPSLPEELII